MKLQRRLFELKDSRLDDPKITVTVALVGKL